MIRINLDKTPLLKRAAQRAAYAANPVLQKERTRRWLPRAETRVRDGRLRRVFGISAEEYDRMHAAQNGLCAICGNPETLIVRGKLRRLAVDHDHGTRKIRRLLCLGCNTGLGKFRHDPALLRTAAAYIEQES